MHIVFICNILAAIQSTVNGFIFLSFVSNSNLICFHLSTTYNCELWISFDIYFICLFTLIFRFAFLKHTHNRRYKKADRDETVNRFIFRHLLRSKFQFLLINISFAYLCHSFHVYLLPTVWWCLKFEKMRSDN